MFAQLHNALNSAVRLLRAIAAICIVGAALMGCTISRQVKSQPETGSGETGVAQQAGVDQTASDPADNDPEKARRRPQLSEADLPSE